MGYLPLVGIVCSGIVVGVLFFLCGEDVHEVSENPETIVKL